MIGSGPAGLAAAQQLTRAGHAVTVYERADAPGGLLRYGIPEFKLEKRHLDRRLAQLRAEGTEFRCGVTAGRRHPRGPAARPATTRSCWPAAPPCRGACRCPAPALAGVHQAMEYLPLANRAVAGTGPAEPAISARGRDVVIIGGGDTGADCLGTALRQGAKSVTQLEILPRPPSVRPPGQPWPTYPMIYRVSGAHEEGGERIYAVSTRAFTADDAGRVRSLVVEEVTPTPAGFEPVEDSEREIRCDLVLLAMGFTGADRDGLLTGLGVDLDPRGNVARDRHFATSVPGVFVAGDMGRGQSLIVWAIAEGRSAAAAVDEFLSGETQLAAAIPATAAPLR